MTLCFSGKAGLIVLLLGMFFIVHGLVELDANRLFGVVYLIGGVILIWISVERLLEKTTDADYTVVLDEAQCVLTHNPEWVNAKLEDILKRGRWRE